MSTPFRTLALIGKYQSPDVAESVLSIARFLRDRGLSVLIEQAARNADRLDVINDLLSGDSKAWFEVEIAGQVAEVRVTNLVVEERQRSAALQRSIVDIQRMRGDRPGPAQSDGKARRGVSPIDRIQQGRK